MCVCVRVRVRVCVCVCCVVYKRDRRTHVGLYSDVNTSEALGVHSPAHPAQVLLPCLTENSVVLLCLAGIMQRPTQVGLLSLSLS